eukprot:1186581-Prorocentrum_minimum.AAC.2
MYVRVHFVFDIWTSRGCRFSIVVFGLRGSKIEGSELPIPLKRIQDRGLRMADSFKEDPITSTQLQKQDGSTSGSRENPPILRPQGCPRTQKARQKNLAEDKGYSTVWVTVLIIRVI